MCRFLSRLRSMSSTCGEIEIFPILLLRLPSSSFLFENTRERERASEREGKRKEKIPLIDRFSLSYTRIHWIESALQIMINTWFICSALVESLKTKCSEKRENKFSPSISKQIKRRILDPFKALLSNEMTYWLSLEFLFCVCAYGRLDIPTHSLRKSRFLLFQRERKSVVLKKELFLDSERLSFTVNFNQVSCSHF